MANASNHYEAAFAAWLSRRGIPFLPIDERARPLADAAAGGVLNRCHTTLKSPDFLVGSPGPRYWLVDIKGRRFPTGSSYWKNWSTRDELESLAVWEELLGKQFCSLLVFAYNVVGDVAPLPAEELFEHRGSLYAFVGIRLDHYTSWSRPLSARWGTVAVLTAQFRALAQPARQFWEQETIRPGNPSGSEQATLTTLPTLTANTSPTCQGL
jgi:hypothetical protein